MGRTGELDAVSQLTTLTWSNYRGDGYRKLLLRRGRLVGAIAIGDWPETNRVQEALQGQRYLWPWQRRRFLNTGSPWPEQDAQDVNDWPAGAVVCQCTGVTRGALGQAMQAGHCSIEAMATATGASSVCGSCKPLLAELAGGQALEPEQGSRTLLWTAAVSLITALLVLLAPAIPFQHSVQDSLRWDLLWRDGLIKQISGFSLLGLGALVSVISLRKRIKRFTAGAFGSWRMLHVILGTLAVATLVAHTGLRLGANLNLALILVFCGLLLAGAVAGGAIGLQHALPRATARRARDISLWLHIVLLWPLPALLGFHILKSYWF